MPVKHLEKTSCRSVELVPVSAASTGTQHGAASSIVTEKSVKKVLIFYDVVKTAKLLVFAE